MTDKQYYVEDGKLQPTPEFLLEQCRGRYKNLFPMFSSRLSHEERLVLHKQVRQVCTGKSFGNVLVCGEKDLLRAFSVFGILSRPHLPSFRLINISRLIDMAFNKNPQSDDDSVFSLYEEVLCISIGYGDFMYQGMADLLEQLMYHSRNTVGQSLWVYYRGTFNSMVHEGYNNVVLAANDLGYEFIDLATEDGTPTLDINRLTPTKRYKKATSTISRNEVHSNVSPDLIHSARHQP